MTTINQRDIGGINCLINKASEPQARLVLAHGAGLPMDSPFMEEMAKLLSERSLEVIRFEFPYMARRRLEGGKPPPDRQPILLTTWRQLIQVLAGESDLPLFIGGKSMGGRMATLVAADGQHPMPIEGVVCLGYPFHPRGKSKVLRTAHLSSIAIPTLIVQGSRDPMGNREEVANYSLSSAILFAWLDTADHDLKPLVKSGFSHAEYLEQAADRIAAFMRLTV